MGTLGPVEARPSTPVDPALTAFGDRPFRHRMGLKPAGPAEWFVPDPAFEFDIGEKRRRLTEDPRRVLLSESGADHAARQAAVAVAGTESLLEAGLSVQADLVVLGRQRDSWRFMAGMVCFPTAWEPTEKLGLSVMAIHEPVPGYADEIGSAVDRYLDRLGPDRVQWRRNWSLTTSDQLWLRPGRSEAPIGDTGSDVWFRSERQTFRRVGEGIIVFGIHVHLWPLAVAIGPTDAAGLANEIRTMPSAFKQYKELLATQEGAILEWLDERSTTD